MNLQYFSFWYYTFKSQKINSNLCDSDIFKNKYIPHYPYIHY